MTLRNPEFLFEGVDRGDAYLEDFLSASSDDDDRGEELAPPDDLLVPALHPAVGAAEAAALVHFAGTKASEGSHITHPPFTDFGPQSLSQYLRTEIDNLRTTKASTAFSAKGKEKAHLQPLSVLPVPCSSRATKHTRRDHDRNICGQSSATPLETPSLATHADKAEHGRDISSGRTKYTPARRRNTVDATSSDHAGHTNEVKGLVVSLRDVSNSRQSTRALAPLHPHAAMRRSSRLARRISDIQDPGSIQSDTGFSHLFPSSSSAAENDFRKREQNSLPSSAHSQASRRFLFEEHTKSKREAVRAVTVDTTNTSGELASPLGELGDNPRHRKAPARASDSILGSDTAPSPEELVYGSASREIPGLHALKTIRAAEGDLPTAQLYSSSSALLSNTEAGEQAPAVFDYGQVVPESIPRSVVREYLSAVQQQQSRQALETTSAERPEDPAYIPARQLVARQRDEKLLERSSRPAPESYPRFLTQTSLPFHHGLRMRATSRRGRDVVNSLEASTSSPLRDAKPLESFNTDLWLDIAKFLSTSDVRNLRLVNTNLARTLSSIQSRNVVINFGQSMFDEGSGGCVSSNGTPARKSMFEQFGDNINQLGIAFEYDVIGLAQARPKVIEKVQDAWFGKFTWPTENYPRYAALQAMEDLVDNNRPLLKEAFKHVTKPSELGLCIDSGHGWLEGPDISDMALFSKRASAGSKIFGKTFKGEDLMDEFSRNEYFKWAQQNTINETIKHMMHNRPGQVAAGKEIRRFLYNVTVRDMESFRDQEQQHDFDVDCHVGGPPGTTAPQMPGLPNAHLNWAQIGANAQVFAHHRQLRAAGTRRASSRRQLQWPLIFNGHNLAAELGGSCSFIQHKTANPICAPLRPGMLTEAQAQWLMETAWAQRAFLSSYTTAILTNKQNFTGIHTLRISKLSSGLLPSLAQREFWGSLPGLQKLQILISPDWRQEHIIGDRFFHTTMPIAPHKAAQRFTQFLRSYVIRIESLHSLSIGYTGGGEHAVGMFARNQHVLPAPIVDDPAHWLIKSNHEANPSSLTKFDHIRDLKFENCWFSPMMLKEFMRQSQDTSLHSLGLDSVSLLTNHDPGIEQPLTTGGNNLQCQLERNEWLHESLPSSAAWTKVLDNITPGITLLERKYAAGLIDQMVKPMPSRSFRGHVQKISLNSCGYVKISLPKGINNTVFNQNSAVTHCVSSTDGGLRARRERFHRSFGGGVTELTPPMPGRVLPTRRSEADENGAKRMMMNTVAPNGEVYPWLGTLTQCVHPIEKRVLEEAWNMEFGWPNNLDRWAAVEDGFFEGGTGRFSGIITTRTQSQPHSPHHSN